ADPQILAVPGHTHDFHRRALLRVQAKAFAQRVLVGPETRRELLVHDGHSWAAFLVICAEGPPADDIDLHGVKVALVHLGIHDGNIFLALGRLVTVRYHDARRLYR